MKGEKKRAASRERQERLLRLFDGEGYEEFHAPKYVFVKHWNGDNGRWQVAIYPIASWRKFNEFNDVHQQNLHIKSITSEE